MKKLLGSCKLTIYEYHKGEIDPSKIIALVTFWLKVEVLSLLFDGNETS